MKDLLIALGFFTDIKFLKNKNINTENRFTLCYFPLVGLLLGLILILWYIISYKIGLGIIAGIVAAVIVSAVTGNVHYCVMFDYLGKSLGAIIYIMFLVIMFLPYTLKEIVIVTGVFILARALSVLLFIDNDYMQEGIYKDLSLKSQRIAVSVITVVWIMAAVALIQMMSIFSFIAVFITYVLFYFGFSHRARVKKSLTDDDINLFIVASEAVILIEIFAGMYLPGILERL